MHRFASMVIVYVIAVLLFVVILAICIYTMKSTNDIHPALIFGAGGGLYTIIVLFILHSRAGTLKATPEEARSREREEEADADAM